MPRKSFDELAAERWQHERARLMDKRTTLETNHAADVAALNQKIAALDAKLRVVGGEVPPTEEEVAP